MTFTPNGKRQSEIRSFAKNVSTLLDIRSFLSRFYDKQEPAVSRLPLAVNVTLNLSNMAASLTVKMSIVA